MKFFRYYIVFRSMCVLLALHIFNISIDMPDAQPDYVAEDLSINDQESFVELVAEKFLGIDNAFTEHDEQDEDNSQSFEMSKIFKINANNLAAEVTFKRMLVSLGKNAIPFCEDLPQFINEINPPPPKA